MFFFLAYSTVDSESNQLTNIFVFVDLLITGWAVVKEVPASFNKKICCPEKSVFRILDDWSSVL